MTRARKTAQPCIALDADGVLLDYNLAYAAAWQRAFGERPAMVDPQAYWPMDRWGVERLAGERLAQFKACLDEAFWSTIPSVAGAVQACRDLVGAGYLLVCVTAMEVQFVQARWRNLRELGFPIEQVVAVGKPVGPGNPKAAAILALRPLAMVDDYGPYLQGLNTGLRTNVHTALIDRDPHGSPNRGSSAAAVHSRHADLAAFASWWLAGGRGLPRRLLRGALP